MPEQRVIVGNVMDVLRDLPASSVHCCVTSPPYFGLRSYATEPQVWGGDSACEHEWSRYVEGSAPKNSGHVGKRAGTFRNGLAYLDQPSFKASGSFCLRCSAWLGELGAEPTVSLYIAHLVGVFAAVHRVLRDDGTCWINIGDSYAGTHQTRAASPRFDGREEAWQPSDNRPALRDIPPKNLLLVPQRLAIALQDFGWTVRSIIVWAKTSCMPESVTDRPTTSHEYVLLLSKRARYFFDHIAVREGPAESSLARIAQPTFDEQIGGPKDYDNGGNGNRSRRALENFATNPGRNLRTVWTLSPEPFPDAHFATFPSELPRRAILAGTSERGVCRACGGPWRRVVERSFRPTQEANNRHGKWGGGGDDRARIATDRRMARGVNDTMTTGWEPTCTCHGHFKTEYVESALTEPITGKPYMDPVKVYVPDIPLDEHPVEPATVLDPFLGSGTTLVVASQLGRNGIGIELSERYANDIALPRIEREGSPLFDTTTVEASPVSVRPQRRRAWELFRQHGLTDAHLDAIRAVGVTDAGKARHITDGFGKNRPEVQALADEAKAVLGGYYREFLTPGSEPPAEVEANGRQDKEQTLPLFAALDGVE